MNGARYAYLREMCRMVQEDNQEIVFVSEDYAAPIFDQFQIEYPEHFLSVGIAEQNGVAVACGIALTGKYPIVYGCAPFPLTRALDQVKSAVAGMHLPMTILNSGIGFGVPEFGATHYNADDISIVRAVPGIRIITPTDETMAEQLAQYSVCCKDPIYARFDKYSDGKIYTKEQIDFDLGFGVVYQPTQPANVVVISCGALLADLRTLAGKWETQGIYAKVIDLYSLPFQENSLIREFGSLPVVTVEEHVLQGGIGTVLLETANEHGVTNTITRIGIDFGRHYPAVFGSREYLMAELGLSKETITEKIAETVRASLNIETGSGESHV